MVWLRATRATSRLARPPSTSRARAPPGSRCQVRPRSGTPPAAEQANRNRAAPPLRIQAVRFCQGSRWPHSRWGTTRTAAAATVSQKRAWGPMARAMLMVTKLTPATTITTPRIPVQFATTSRSSRRQNSCRGVGSGRRCGLLAATPGRGLLGATGALGLLLRAGLALAV